MTHQILFIEDNPVLLELVSEILKREGHSVKTAADGLQALNILEEYTPDIIFTDLIIPKIDGQTLCQIIRSKTRLVNTYLVILSGIATEAELDLDKLGVDACIAKGKNIKKHIVAILEKIKKGSLRGEDTRTYGFEDVSAREATVGLIESKKHLEVILANLSDGLVEVTPEGVIILANSAAETLLSLSQDQLLGSNFFEFFQEEDKQHAINLFENAQQNSSQVNESQPITLGNRFLTFKICPLDKNARPSCIIIIHDITERKQLEEKLKILSTVDPLTGAYNRRAFEDFFDQESERSRRYKTPLSLIIFDIDHFKQVNDVYGHDAGDKVLQEIANVCKMHNRPLDFLYRWGGEEFFILLTETGIEGAQNMAERYRSIIESWNFHIQSKITVSLGVSQFHSSDNAETLIKRADKALYKAKNGGRNQVSVLSH